MCTVQPESIMAVGFDYLSRARQAFEKAHPLYDERNDPNKADELNSKNVKSALHYLALAYDEISAIKENDL